MERLELAGFELVGESEAHVKLTKVINDEGFVVTLKVLVPRPAEGEELAVGSLRAVLEQALMDRSDFEGLGEPQEPPSSLDLRLTYELRSRIEALSQADEGATSAN